MPRFLPHVWAWDTRWPVWTALPKRSCDTTKPLPATRGCRRLSLPRAFALARLDRPEEAERRYRRAIALRPDFAAAWMNFGCLLREQGRELCAEAALRRSVELRPDLVSGWINLALLKREMGRMDEAEGHLKRAEAIDAERPEIQISTQIAWVQFYVARRELGSAWEWLQKALAREPENPEAANMHGILLHSEGRFAEAVAAFERAEALGSTQAASNCGNSLLDLGRAREALAAHARAADLDPRNPGTRYNLALTQLRNGPVDRRLAEL